MVQAKAEPEVARVAAFAARRRRRELLARSTQDATNALPPDPQQQIFIGNFEYEAQERDIVRLFERYGPVEKIDMKSGAFRRRRRLGAVIAAARFFFPLDSSRPSLSI